MDELGHVESGHPLQQVSDQVAEAPAFIVGAFLEPLSEVPGKRGADPLRLPAEQVGYPHRGSGAPEGLGG